MANTLANQNNNPGNLRDPQTGGFRKFSSHEEGYAALLNDLQSKISGKSSTGLNGESTLYDFSKAYAPKSDKNDPAQYTANLANSLKVRPDTKLKDLQPRIGEFAQAVSKNEGYVEPNPTPSPSSQAPSLSGIQTAQASPETPSASPTPPTPETPKKEGLISSIIRGVTQPVATMIARPIQLGAELLGATSDQVDEASSKVPFFGEGNRLATPKNSSDVLKDVGRGLETVSLGLPVGDIAQAAKTGLVSGIGSGLEDSGTASGAVKGGLLGAGLGFGGGALGKVFQSLPKSLTSSAFKGLDNSQIEKVLAEKSIGSTENILSQSDKALGKYGSQIDNILSNSEARGAGNDSVKKTLLDFPEYNTKTGVDKMLTKVKTLLSNSNTAGLDRGTIVGYIDKIKNGTATLYEKNKVRSAIDSATKGGYAKLAKAMNPSAGHDLAMTFANKLRDEVQSWEPQTIPIFKEFSKEMGIQKAISQASKKKGGGLLQWSDLAPFLEGNAVGGIPGALTGVAVKRASGSTAGKFAIAKGIQGLGNIVRPVTNRAGLLSTQLKNN